MKTMFVLLLGVGIGAAAVWQIGRHPTAAVATLVTCSAVPCPSV